MSLTSSIGGDPVQIYAVSLSQLQVVVKVVMAVGSVVETDGVLPLRAVEGGGVGGLTAGGPTTSLAAGGGRPLRIM